MRYESSPHQREIYYNKHAETLKIITRKEKKDIKNNVDRYEVQNGDIVYKNAEIIVSTYYGIDEKNIAERESFIEFLLRILEIRIEDDFEDSIYTGVSGVIFFGLFKLGIGLEATKALLTNKDNSAATIIDPIYEILESDIKYFSSNELGNIQDKIRDFNYNYDDTTQRKKEEIDDKITELRFQDLKGKLQGIVTEINNDKKQVQEYLKNFGFDEHYNITLNEIDKFLNTSSEITLASAIGSFREFFKNFFIDLSKKIAELNGLENVPEGIDSTTDIGHARAYIKKEFGLSSDEKRLIDAYKDITNNSGSHAILKEKRYLRLARNIGIEISLFMLSKFEDYKKEKE